MLTKEEIYKFSKINDDIDERCNNIFNFIKNEYHDILPKSKTSNKYIYNNFVVNIVDETYEECNKLELYFYTGNGNEIKYIQIPLKVLYGDYEFHIKEFYEKKVEFRKNYEMWEDST